MEWTHTIIQGMWITMGYVQNKGNVEAPFDGPFIDLSYGQ